MHITTANNALSALIDNHLHQGNELGIDQRRILWKRVVDLNDRALRHVTVGLGGPLNGIPREDGFDITVASEIMAILCLATDVEDLKRRLANIVIGYRYNRTPVSVGDLQVEGALALILKDAIKPNLVQTIYGTPAFVHGGPFANIAHGCNSVLATTTALHLADYTVTEAGFGADLGAEKFLDIKTPNLPTAPDAVVIVATLRALKMNGGVAKDALTEENVEAVRAGFANLKRHVENIRKFGIPAFIIPAFIALCGLRMMGAYKKLNLTKWFMGMALVMIWSSITFAKALTPLMGDQVYNPGGDHGAFCVQYMENLVGTPGLIAILVIIMLAYLTYLTSETITVVRKMINPFGYIRDKVKFTVVHDSKGDNTENVYDDEVVIEEEPVEPTEYVDPTLAEPIDLPTEPTIVLQGCPGGSRISPDECGGLLI